MQELEINNVLNNNIDISKEQNSFLETKVGNIINSAVNIGLKYILPDIVEDEIIDIKDTMIKSRPFRWNKKSNRFCNWIREKCYRYRNRKF